MIIFQKPNIPSQVDGITCVKISTTMAKAKFLKFKSHITCKMYMNPNRADYYCPVTACPEVFYSLFTTQLVNVHICYSLKKDPVYFFTSL